MKTKLLSFLCIAGFLLFSNNSTAQTQLSAGDIVVFWNQTDTPDTFAFATFVNIAAGTVIYFTDCGVVPGGTLDPLGCGEGAVAYTAPTGGLNIGDIVIYDSVTPAAEFANYSLTGVINATSGPALSTGGDQVLVFQESGNPGGSANAAANPNFIFINNTASTLFTGDDSNSTTETNLPTGLTDIGLPRTALAVGSGPGPSDEFDNSVYIGPYSFATVLEAQTAMTNPANYESTNAITDSPYSLYVSFIPNRITITTLSVDEFDLDSAFLLYPNPSLGMVTLKNNNSVLHGIQIMDVNGRIVANYPIQGITSNFEMDLNELSSGMYLVRIDSDKGSVVKKLMLR